MGKVRDTARMTWDAMRGIPTFGKDPAKRDYASSVAPMTRTSDPAARIAAHVEASRDARDRVKDAPQVPRPRTEEDAVSQMRAMNRIRRHVQRALDPVRPRRG